MPLLLLSACGSLPLPPWKKAEPPATSVPAGSGQSGGSAEPSRSDAGAASAGAGSSGSAGSGSATTTGTDASGDTASTEKKSRFGFLRRNTPPPAATAAPGATGAPGTAQIPEQARTEFDRAVGLLRSGKNAEAELEFKRLAGAYPQFAGPRINLGIIHRKANRLEQSEAALQEALERNRDSAVAWNELGVTQRMRGEFKMAQDSYENAIRIDPDFAPAYRNLGVLLDLYVGDAEAALDNFERYKELSNEDKPVTGWIAELRQRTGKPPIRRQPVAPANDAPAEGGAAPADGNGTDGSQGQAPNDAPAQDAPPAEPQRAGD